MNSLFNSLKETIINVKNIIIGKKPADSTESPEKSVEIQKPSTLVDKSKKKCMNVLELDYDCPKCGFVDEIHPTAKDGNRTIKCGKCEEFIRLDGKTIEKPDYALKRSLLDIEIDLVKKETNACMFAQAYDADSEGGYVIFDSYRKKQITYCDNSDKLRSLYRERDNIGRVNVIKYCDCGCNIVTIH